MIYFDQAASSFPKPSEVMEQMMEVMTNIGANPGRGGHKLSRSGAHIINQTRNKAAELFGCSNPKKCIFFQNATIALNQAIKGISWSKGDHVIASSMEHNSVRRPLENVKNEYGVDVSYIGWDENRKLFLESVEREIKEETKVLIMTHASNVTGAILPLDEILEMAKSHNLLTIVDASQTAGHIPIDMKKQHINLLAFPGHKGLLGPQGTGMLLVEGEFDMEPIHHGGTGISSEDVNQPKVWPERLESGTLNTPGIAGLLGAFKAYEQRKHENVPRETMLAKQILKGLNGISYVRHYSPRAEELLLPIVAFNIKDIPSQEIATILDSHYDIAVRAGLHCSPLTHETLSTIEQGVVRVSVSLYNTEEEVTTFLKAVEEIGEAYDNLTF